MHGDLYIVTLRRKSCDALGPGQYRNAVASGQVANTIFHRIPSHRLVTRRYRVTVLTWSNTGP